MLARRLLVLIAVLLVVGAVATAIAPQNELDDERATTPASTPTTTLPAATGSPRVAGTTVTAALPGPTGGKTTVVHAQVGDLVDLTVRSPGPDTVGIEGYDQIQAADADSPARFSFFADEPGNFAVTLQDAGTIVGRLEIEPRA